MPQVIPFLILGLSQVDGIAEDPTSFLAAIVAPGFYSVYTGFRGDECTGCLSPPGLYRRTILDQSDLGGGRKDDLKRDTAFDLDLLAHTR